MDRETFLKALKDTAAAKPVPVKTKQWGTVYVRSVTVAEAEELQATADSNDKNRFARGAARVICDEEGKRLLNPDDEADVALLASQPWPLLRKVLGSSGLDVGDEPGN